MERIEKKICNTQRAIYVYAAKQGYSPEEFSNAFLKSEFCSEAFDTDYSRYQFETPMECMDFILPEIGNDISKSCCSDTDLVGYVGYIYRYLYYVTPYSSSELADKIAYDDIARTIESSMIQGEQLTVEDICNEYGLEFDLDKL